MRLLTHNMLTCTVKQCSNNFPLTIDAKEQDSDESEFRPDFVKHLIPKLDWSALCAAVQQLGMQALPPEMPDNLLSDEDMLKMLHHLLVELRVSAGTLTCPGCSRVYNIRNSIPNMALNHDEV